MDGLFAGGWISVPDWAPLALAGLIAAIGAAALLHSARTRSKRPPS